LPVKNVELIYWKLDKEDDIQKKLNFIASNLHPNGSLFIESANALSYLIKFHEFIKTVPFNLQHLIISSNPSTVGCRTEKLVPGFSYIAHFTPNKSCRLDKRMIGKIQGKEEGSCLWDVEEIKFELMIRMVDILPESPILEVSRKSDLELKETCQRVGVLYKHLKDLV